MARRDVKLALFESRSLTRAFKKSNSCNKSSLTRVRSKTCAYRRLGFNGRMNPKVFTCVVVAGCMLSVIASGQTLTISGSVCSCDSKSITVQEGTHYYVIKRTAATSIDGACSSGSNVTVQCKSPDAQRKEGSCQDTKSPTPPSG